MKPLITLFEDEHYIAVDKPSGLLSIPNRNNSEVNVFDYLKRSYSDIKLIHRIDKATSGALIFAKSTDAQRELSILFEQHQIFKEYAAIVANSPKEESGTIENYIDEQPNKKGTYRIAYQGKGKIAVSHYEIKEKFRKHSLLSFQIETGRTHQIRVHAQYVGHALLGDDKYGPIDGNREFRELGLRRLFLHAASLRFKLPDSEQFLRVQAPLNDDLALLLEKLSAQTADLEQEL